jgi:glycosyltransferase involved in cell wall biosynthesis
MNFIALYKSPYYGGGVQRTAGILMTAIDKGKKSDFTILCSDDNQEKNFQYNDFECVNFKFKGFDILEKILMLKSLIQSFRIFRYLQKHSTKESIILIHTIEMCVFVSLFRGFFQKKKIVLFSHGSIFEAYSTYVYKRLPMKFWYIKGVYFFVRYYFYLLEKISLSGADECIFISQKNLDFSKKHFNNQKKSTIISNSFEIPEIKAKPVLKMDANTQFTAIIIGSTIYMKGLDILLEITKKFTNCKLKVVGFDDFKAAGKADKYENLEFLGRLKQDEVKKAISESDFLLMPSRIESFCNVVIEALLEGKPFIASRTCEHAPFDYNHFGMLLDSYDPEDWLTAINKMSTPLVYNQFANNIYKDLDTSPVDIKNNFKKYVEFLT